jgi:hypothetical protein
MSARDLGYPFDAEIFRDRVAEDLADHEPSLEIQAQPGLLSVDAGRKWFAESIHAKVCAEGQRARQQVRPPAAPARIGGRVRHASSYAWRVGPVIYLWLGHLSMDPLSLWDPRYGVGLPSAIQPRAAAASAMATPSQ